MSPQTRLNNAQLKSNMRSYSYDRGLDNHTSRQPLFYETQVSRGRGDVEREKMMSPEPLNYSSIVKIKQQQSKNASTDSRSFENKANFRDNEQHGSPSLSRRMVTRVVHELPDNTNEHYSPDLTKSSWTSMNHVMTSPLPTRHSSQPTTNHNETHFSDVQLLGRTGRAALDTIDLVIDTRNRHRNLTSHAQSESNGLLTTYPGSRNAPTSSHFLQQSSNIFELDAHEQSLGRSCEPNFSTAFSNQPILTADVMTNQSSSGPRSIGTQALDASTARIQPRQASTPGASTLGGSAGLTSNNPDHSGVSMSRNQVLNFFVFGGQTTKTSVPDLQTQHTSQSRLVTAHPVPTELHPDVTDGRELTQSEKEWREVTIYHKQTQTGGLQEVQYRQNIQVWFDI